MTSLLTLENNVNDNSDNFDENISKNKWSGFVDDISKNNVFENNE